MSWQLQAFSLWFVLSCHLTPPPRACITLNAKMPCYQTLLSGAPGMLMETFLKVFPVSWKWSVPSPGPVLGQSWGQTSTSVWTGSISAGQGPSEPLWENTQALLLRVCWRLGWTWGGDCSIASCSETWSWHLFLFLGPEPNHLLNLKGKVNIWNKLECSDQTAPSPDLCAPGSAVCWSPLRALPKECDAVCLSSQYPGLSGLHFVLYFPVPWPSSVEDYSIPTSGGCYEDW